MAWWIDGITGSIRDAGRSPGAAWLGPYPSRSAADNALHAHGGGPGPGAGGGGNIGGRLISEAEKFIGAPYVWGGESPKGFDCSGLVQYSLEKLGVKNVPRTSEEQWAWVRRISKAQLSAGDLIFMQYPGEASPGHVAIYAGGGQIIQAPGTGGHVEKVPWSPAATAAGGGQVIGYGRVAGAGAGVGANVPGGPPGGGGNPGVGSVIGGILKGLFPGTSWGSDIQAGAKASSGLGDIATSITGVAGSLGKIASAVDWFLKPNHWVRIFCGIIGFQALAAGVVIMTQVKDVQVAGIGPPPAVQTAALPLGILLVGAGGVLLFVAFHNLPENVTNIPTLIGHVRDEAKASKAAA